MAATSALGARQPLELWIRDLHKALPPRGLIVSNVEIGEADRSLSAMAIRLWAGTGLTTFQFFTKSPPSWRIWPATQNCPSRDQRAVIMRVQVKSLSIVAVIAATPAWADMLGGEKSDCRIIEEAARTNLLPIGLLTRLLWTESRFQADALSPKGALGVAQFMPGTADERGLSNPFDPEKAIPQAARLLADLDRRFSNTGLAVAAYNAGSKRVSDWLANSQPLPKETQNFVLAVTGHNPSEWSTIGGYLLTVETQSCLALTASLAAHPFNNREGPVVRGYSNPYGSSGGPPYPYGSSSQYYIGYHKSDGSRYPYGSNSQYYIGYSNR